MPPKQARAKATAAAAAAGGVGTAAAAATPEVAAKRGRPKKAPAADDSQAGVSAETAADTETPAKRPRGKAAAKAAAKAEAPSEASPDAGQDAKKLKRTLTPKRDKNAPLERTATPLQLVPPDLSGRTLKLVSLNVAGLRSLLNGDKAKVLRALVEEERPDIFCLNEHKLKVEDVEENEAKLRELLPKEYGTFHWTCSTAKKGYSGVAVIFRHATDGESSAVANPAAVKVTEGMGALGAGDPIAAEEGRLLTVELPEVTLVAVYVPNSGVDLGRLAYRVDRKQKHCWEGKFAAYVSELRESRGKPVVVIGDMNCCWKVQDIWNMYDRPNFPDGLAEKPVADQYLGLTQLKKAAGLTPEERESFPKMLAEADLVDTFRTLHPTASGVFSYFSQRFAQNRPMNKGLRLDYVLASSSLCRHLKPVDASSAAEVPAPAADDGSPVPRMLDSFILDQRDLVADHAPVGCILLLRS